MSEPLSDEQKAALDTSLLESGCHGFLGDHAELYAAVESIIAERERASCRPGEGK